ncbi:hypothetical protein [Sulfitobacter sp. S190]|uniref:hypothetical protein n=1 Tax=Sulfitobacter sp. S190 TaxID=2867022 RepID=UPI0021A76BB2|nr:hypothetical protein [Sulfitobacter sp. S190]UWR22856.1 hypothetical protein K3756_02325 [Sulfitobacter sp. S190]
MRRILIHPGFHHTGASRLQKTLRANRAALAPHVHMLFRPGMAALCTSARAYSVSRSDLDLGMVKFEAASLAQSLSEVRAPTIILSAEALSGRLPGRKGLRGYTAAPKLAQAIALAFEAAVPDDEIILFYTIRDADGWLHRSYRQHLRTARMVLDRDDYVSRFAGSADLSAAVDTVAEAVPHLSVLRADAAAENTRPLGTLDLLLDCVGVPDARRKGLAPPPDADADPDPALDAALLELNRGDMQGTDLRDAKRALIARAA